MTTIQRLRRELKEEREALRKVIQQQRDERKYIQWVWQERELLRARIARLELFNAKR